MITHNELLQFLKERPAINLVEFAKQSEISARTLHYAISEARLSKTTTAKLIKTMRLYGWKS